MNDLISRSALLETIEKSRKAHASVRSRLTVGDMEQMIKGARSVDAEVVVRCDDCIHCEPHNCPGLEEEALRYCLRFDTLVSECGFCHKGAKMDAEVEG